MEIIFSPKFVKEYKKLPTSVKKNFEGLEKIFRNNPFDSKLKTYKLKGRLSGLLSFSISFKYRIIFELSEDEQTAFFHLVGSHDIYQ
jgi:mRNA-degrading endonuclease RelE of RelBE toxin-antitoxin system